MNIVFVGVCICWSSEYLIEIVLDVYECICLRLENKMIEGK